MPGPEPLAGAGPNGGAGAEPRRGTGWGRRGGVPCGAAVVAGAARGTPGLRAAGCFRLPQRVGEGQKAPAAAWGRGLGCFPAFRGGPVPFSGWVCTDKALNCQGGLISYRNEQLDTCNSGWKVVRVRSRQLQC